MSSFSSPKLYMPLQLTSVGGPASFQRKLVSELRFRGIEVDFGLYNETQQAGLVINATRNLYGLVHIKRTGGRIVQRLGLPFPSNSHLPISQSKRIRTWLGMQNVAFTRRYVADRIVYQSVFAKECWEKEHGAVNKPSRIIYNGVELTLFAPDGEKYISPDDICIISVEGTQIYPEHSPAFVATKALRQKGYSAELLVFGKPWGDAAIRWAAYPFVNFKGVVPNEELPCYYRGATLYVLNDIVAACPNSVLEALACGTPVLGYAPGVLSEMLTPEAGRCVVVKGDPWKGEQPGNVEGLVNAALEIIENNRQFRIGAHRLAEERYGLDRMVNAYINVLFD